MTDELTESPQFNIRYTSQLDFGALNRWLHNPAVAKWFPTSTEQEATHMAKNWIAFSRYKSSLTATLHSQTIGVVTIFLMPYKKVAHMGMVYIAVDPEFQNRGVGSCLVKNINHLAKNYLNLESLHIELFSNCPAIPVFLKQGYYQVFCQPKHAKIDGTYYDRVVMEVKLV
ncbi:MAG: GNAT family N-acetyltransferase [Simkaniaceae bacterium]|nr:GNAT family N-acetyltransferase [Simkaniaceae bacterium]